MREFAVVDRSGNLVRGGSPMTTDACRPAHPSPSA